jgi:hypothetical protein
LESALRGKMHASQRFYSTNGLNSLFTSPLHPAYSRGGCQMRTHWDMQFQTLPGPLQPGTKADNPRKGDDQCRGCEIMSGSRIKKRQ